MGEKAEPDLTEVHSYIRHLITSTVTWFTWFIALNYGALAWTATNLQAARGNLVAAVLVALVFASNNALGVVWLRHLTAYFRAKAAAVPDGQVIPAETYAFAFRLATAALVVTGSVWLVFIGLFCV